MVTGRWLLDRDGNYKLEIAMAALQSDRFSQVLLYSIYSHNLHPIHTLSMYPHYITHVFPYLVNPQSSYNDVMNSDDCLAPRVVTLCTMEDNMTAPNGGHCEVLPPEL